MSTQNPSSPGAPAISTPADLEQRTLRKVMARLIPFMFILYMVCILDRVNINVAVLTMKPDLGFSDRIYGFGVAIFFISYGIFEVPSNVILERIGARVWIARIMLTWGAIAAAMMFIKTPMSFYVLRFLLGVAEAGFFPGMILYLTYWFPESIRGRAVGLFGLAGTAANIIGGPLGATLMKLNGFGGLRGWQWVFLLEGVPSMLLGIVVLCYMTDRPEKATWLAPEERDWLAARLRREQEARQRHHHLSLLQAFSYPRVLHLCAVFFLFILSGSGIGNFSNLVLQQRSTWTVSQILWISTIPNLIGAVVVILAAHHSDRTRERRLFVMAGMLVVMLGIFVCAATTSAHITVVGLCIIAIGSGVFSAPFWALTTGFLSGLAAAGGIAFINSVGNTGSSVGPSLMGYVADLTRTYEPGMYILAGVAALGSFVAFLLPPDPAQRPIAEMELAEA